ncbi:MAG: FecR family protein [Elusimicrobia bacterium]|nr:FecR family protein [Elusimicrobiota bacterium]
MKLIVKKCSFHVFLILSYFYCFSCILYSSQMAGIVTNTKGSVQVLNNKGKDWKKAKVGDFLYEGDTIKTLTKSQSAVTFTNGTMIKSNQNTEFFVVIAEKLEKIGSQIKMKAGRVWTKVRPKTKFEIHTPVAIVAVRGTEFDTDLSGDRLDLTVFEGVVNVKNNFGEVNVKKGKKTTVGAGAPEPPSDTKKEEQSNWQDEIVSKGAISIKSLSNKPQSSVPFEINVSVNDINGKLDKTSKETITLKSESPDILFSNDGKVWSGELQITPVEGVAKASVKIEVKIAGTFSIIAFVENYTPAILNIAASLPKNKNLKIKIKSDEGEKEILLKFKKKS